MFSGFYINAGYEDKSGFDVACEKLALCSLIEQVQYIYKRPGYRWNAAHLRFRVVSKEGQHVPGMDEKAKTGHEVLRAARDAVQKLNPNAKIFYRWHLEHSDSVGWHYHVAIFMNGNELNGVKAIVAELFANGAHSVESINPDFSRVRDSEAREYFLSRDIKFDSNINYLPLRKEIDFEYVIYWFSYMTKKATKPKNARTCGGTQLPRRIVKTRSERVK